MSIIKYIGTITAYIGAKTETAPSTDTASSGLNGRLQRIAQRLAALVSGSTDSNVKLDALNTHTSDNKALLTTLKDDTALVKADIASLKTIETDSQALLTTLRDDTALIKADIASLETIETDSQALLTTLRDDTALIKADIASLETIETDSQALLTTLRDDTALIKADIATIKDTLAQTGAITYNNIIVAKTVAETSADIQLTKSAYALTALGLAGGETVILQVKDTVTGAYFNYLTLTAAAPVANVTYLPVTARLNKSATAASVGVVLSYR